MQPLSKEDSVEFESLDDALARGVINLDEYNEHHLNYYEKKAESDENI